MLNRILAFVGAVALVAAQPAVALAAHPVVYAPPHIMLPAPQPNIPLTIHVQPKPLPLPEARHLTLQPPTTYGLHPAVSLYPWYYRQSRASYLWFPTFLQPACYANANAWGSSSYSADQQWDATIGSLVDGKANLLSPQSFSGGFASSDPGATPASPFTFQAGFNAATCGPSFFTFTQ